MPAGGYLVWSADSAGARTVWLDGGGEVVARRRGVFIASGARLWRWVDRQVRYTGVDCACYRANPIDPQCEPLTQPVGLSELVDEADGRRLVIHGPDEDEEDHENAPPVLTARPIAGVGPYLFTESHAETDGCGAHGFIGTWREMYHLPTGTRLQTDTTRISPRDSIAGLEALNAPNPLDEPVEAFGVNEVEAWWTPAGTLEVGLRFYTSVPFAFSDEGSYSRSERITTRTPPRWLVPWLRAPEPVRRHWRAEPPAARAGWSAVDSAHAPALRRRFRG